MDHRCEARPVVRDELRRDHEHGGRVRCARESGVQRVCQPTWEGRVDPEPRLRDISDDHLHLRARSHVTHSAPLIIRGERTRDRADEANPLDRRAARQPAFDQRVQPVLRVQGAGAVRSFRRALHDDDATGARPGAVCRVDCDGAQRAQQHPAAELEHALGQRVSGVGVRGPEGAGQEGTHTG